MTINPKAPLEVGICVRDLERAERFYREVQTRPGTRLAFFRDSEGNPLELVQHFGKIVLET